ncbi:GNAT family N-acetyltransferase [Chitinophaga eiseniae]|uniref:GNAT family N-acetyltransferase n=1 Tax=Chitinophaga eiseniae TaxID=634771 RepID=A0A847SNS8_9BACT|nr:GNAT family N-acetyltransferase [Chitinophaga eiseniae]NLR79076.1 GNAT family N-acetyltransferase [Chitinophaga eiseniae]
MNFTGLTLTKIDTQSIAKTFDCGDTELNEFLLSKALHYKNELLAVTYLLKDKERTVAFFSVFNDSLWIREQDFVSKSAFKKFRRGIVSHPKRHLEYYPAMKIGRLGVSNQVQKGGIGKGIIDWIIGLAVKHNNECACKLITVDAYAQSTRFYERNGFQYLDHMDKNVDTKQMYLDLTPYVNTMPESPIVLMN